MVNLRNRLVLSHVLLVLFITLLLGITLIYVLETQVISVDLSVQLIRRANLLIEFAADNPAIWSDPSQAQAFINRFRERTQAQLMLLNADGEILASSDPTDKSMLGRPLSNPDITTVLNGQQIIYVAYNQERLKDIVEILSGYSYEPLEDIVDVLVPVFGEDGRVVGVIRLTHQLESAHESFERPRSLILEILTVGLVLGIIAGLILAITMEKPIARLNRAINQLSSDEQLSPLPEQGPPEIRVLTRTFNVLVERLRILREARQQLLDNLVHELRRPMAALRSANYALLDGAADDVLLRDELLQGIDLELRTLQRLIDDLSRVQEQGLGSLELSLETTSLTEWIPAMLGPWREKAQRKGLRWEAKIPTDLPSISIDPNRLDQALGNLLSNAVKYTPSGGTISVAAGYTDKAVWIQVIDTGIGIDPEELPLVFKPFFRGRTKSHFVQGMGLGLSIARDLILAHGGRLDVDTNLESGTGFTIWLPLTF